MENSSALEPLHSEKELHQQWLEKLFLQKLGSPVTVLSWQCVTPSDRQGFLSDIAFVVVKYISKDIKETESQLVFKFLPQDNVKKQFVLDGGLAEREAEFYKLTSSSVCWEICHKSGMVMPVPECYFAGYTEDSITIVMQDLNSDNYKTLIVKEGSTVAQTKAALRAIAVVHATGYLYLARDGGTGNLGTIAQPVSSDTLDQIFIPNLQTLVKIVFECSFVDHHLEKMATNLELQPLQSYKEIDQQWLKKMLSKKFGCSVCVHSWSSTLPEKQEGFLSEIAFINVKYTVKGSEENETQLVFKFLPQDTGLITFLANGGLARREVEFYQFAISPRFQEMLQKCGLVLPIPEAYYTGYKEDAITIVLHNLSVDKYKSVIVKDGSTLAQTKTALQAVAILHAAGVLYLHQYGQDDDLSNLAEEFKTNFYDQFFIPNLKVLARMFKGTSLADTFTSLIPLVKHIYLTPRRCPLLHTIVHGDLWAGQLLFSDDESAASIIDWQFCHIDTPVSDIMSMLLMSSDPKILEDNLGEVLESYWCTFSKVVTAGGASVEVSLEQLSANVEEMWMYGFMFLAVSIMDFLNGDNISDYRLGGYLCFLEKKGVFKKFLEEFEH